MSDISKILLFICTAFLVTSVAGQAGRTEQVTGGKINQRRSTPTPTPESSPVEPDADLVPDDGDVIKVDTQLVSVPVRVMDRTGKFIAGIGREKFRVFENNIEQEIAMFSNEHEPFTVALVLDMSYSTTFKINEIQSAAIAFIDQLRPQDKVMVVSFDQEIHILCDPTNDRKEIYRAIKSTKIATGTSLYEAIDQVMNKSFGKVDGRKAIILFSDGVDTTSRRSSDMSNLSDALESSSLVYTIKYDTFADVQRMKQGTVITKVPPITIPTQTQPPGFPFPTSTMGTPSSQGTTEEEYKKAGEYLNEIAIRTGGRLYEASTVSYLAEAYSKIASELREFYSIGYYPHQELTKKRNASIKVKVDQPGVVVRSRETFIRRKTESR